MQDVGTAVSTVDNSKLNYGGKINIKRFTQKFAKLITMDLENYKGGLFYRRYTKADIARFIANPKTCEKELRRAVCFIYDASPHFKRLIRYFAGLNDLVYVVSPYKMDIKRANKKTVYQSLVKTLSVLSNFSIKTQFPRIVRTVLREDVFYGTMRVSDNEITIQRLPSDYCRITSISENVFNVSFNFRYFDLHERSLRHYPDEFRIKYEEYKKRIRGVDSSPTASIDGRVNSCNAWIELDAPTSFAIKCNDDNVFYAMPPFAGILPEVFDIDDYKQMKLDRTELENYAMLAMRIPMTSSGEWGIDLKKAEEFWGNLDSVLPDRVGSVLTPMAIDKISFERTTTADKDTITEAEQALFTAAGVSSLLFNNGSPSANALLLSIKADQMITYDIVKNIQCVINRYIHSLKFGRNFTVTFLDCSPYNRKELGDTYLKAAAYGFPTISMYLATQGLGQAETDAMTFLETDVLGLQERFKPVINSAQVSTSADDSAGAPTKDDDELTDSGEQSREDGDDW